MLINFWFTICLLMVAANAEDSSDTPCLASSPCTGPPAYPTPSTTPQPIPPTAPSTVSPAVPGPLPPSCNNCPQPDCSMVPSGTTFPYANHCKLFYQCVGGSAVVSVCSNGYWYDRSLSKCMLCDLVKNCEAQKD